MGRFARHLIHGQRTSWPPRPSPSEQARRMIQMSIRVGIAMCEGAFSWQNALSHACAVANWLAGAVKPAAGTL